MANIDWPANPIIGDIHTIQRVLLILIECFNLALRFMKLNVTWQVLPIQLKCF